MLNTRLLYVGKKADFPVPRAIEWSRTGLGGAASLLLSSCVSIPHELEQLLARGRRLNQVRNCAVGPTWSSCLQFGKRSFRADPRRAMARSRECGRSRC